MATSILQRINLAVIPACLCLSQLRLRPQGQGLGQLPPALHSPRRVARPPLRECFQPQLLDSSVLLSGVPGQSPVNLLHIVSR